MGAGGGVVGWLERTPRIPKNGLYLYKAQHIRSKETNTAGSVTLLYIQCYIFQLNNYVILIELIMPF